MQMVGAEGVLQADWVVVDELHVLIRLDHGYEVMRRSLDVIEFPGEQGVDRLLMIRDREPLDAVDFRDLAASKTLRRLGAWLVFVELDIDRLIAGLPLV